MAKKIALIIILILAHACGNVPLTPKGKIVTVTAKQLPDDCRMINEVKVSCSYLGNNVEREYIFNHLKNRAGRMGANYIQLYDVTGCSANGMAFRCQHNPARRHLTSN